MKKVEIGLTALLLAIAIMAGWTGAFGTGEGKWHGYMVDRQCADSVKQDIEPKSFLQHHTKDCALMPNCQVRGYSLYTHGKWFDFDKRGNKLAIEVLKASPRKRGFYVEVTGTAQGRVIKVLSIREIGESKAQ